MTLASPRSILVLSGRYHIISNASLVINCIMSTSLKSIIVYYEDKLSQSGDRILSSHITKSFSNLEWRPHTDHTCEILVVYLKKLLTDAGRRVDGRGIGSGHANYTVLIGKGICFITKNLGKDSKWLILVWKGIGKLLK